MHFITRTCAATAVVATGLLWVSPAARLDAQTSTTGATRPIDLAAESAAKRLRSAGRTAAPIPGQAGAVKVSAGDGPGVVWIEGTEFGLGTIEIDVRGKDALNASYLGVAFHRRDDNTYEDVYLRPFNFRATDPMRHQHAVQYEAMPDNAWMPLRQKFPEEFENPVDASVDPNAWVTLRLVVTADRVQIFAGKVGTPTLEVRRLSSHNQGQIGLWVGNTSDGDFANLRLTPAR